jgi:hypothetical protein
MAIYFSLSEGASLLRPSERIPDEKSGKQDCGDAEPHWHPSISADEKPAGKSDDINPTEPP